MLPNVLAYLDLASGSMIIQAAIAGIVVVPVLLRNKIRALFGRNKSTQVVEPTPDIEGSVPEVAVDAVSSDRT